MTTSLGFEDCRIATHLVGGAATCSEGFVISFLKVSLACLGCMTAAVQPSGLGNSQKFVYKTFRTSGRPTRYLIINYIVVTSMHSLPIRTTGQLFLHSWRHLFGLHRSLLTMAILVLVSLSAASFRLAFFGGILTPRSVSHSALPSVLTQGIIGRSVTYVVTKVNTLYVL